MVYIFLRSVRYDGNICNENNGLVVSGLDVDIDGCNFSLADLYEPLTIDYSYVSQHLQTFALDSSIQSNPLRVHLYSVYVNNQLSTDYEVLENAVEFANALPYYSTVRIEVRYFD